MSDFKLEPKQIEQQKLIAENQFVLAEGGSRCFVPSQEVITINGPVMISEIKPGDRVFTMNESTEEREFKTVQQVHRFTGNKKRMITVKLKTGETITATEDHEIRFNGGWHDLDFVKWFMKKCPGMPTKPLQFDLPPNDIASIEYSDDQSEVYDLTIQDNHNYFLALDKPVLVHNSGKTFGFVNAVFIRACLKPSDHLICRLRFAHVKRAVCYQTFPRLMRARGIPPTAITLNKTDWFYELPNGSKIWIAGLDEGPRLEKVLGNDFATIYINEASEVAYESFDILLSRLLPPVGLRGKMFIDYNPPSRNHWGFKMFHDRKFPDGTPVPEDNFALIKMNPDDNSHLPPEYFKTLSMMSQAKQKRFRFGEYSDDQGTLWKREYFKRTTVKDDMLRVVVGVDPSGSVEGDEIGIIVAAMTPFHDDNGLELFTVLDDYSLHGSPREWADAVNDAYKKWGADIVVAEKNFGGDMVEDVIKRNHRNMNVKLITSSRSKVIRAEPISALYETGRVAHYIEAGPAGVVNPFQTLEDELCQYEPGKSKSPNRLDALVFTLSELSGDGPSMFDVL